jgi:predicted nucleic acid-binding Zn ribbon protein
MAPNTTHQMSHKNRAPEKIADALSAYLKEAGLDARMVQAAVVPEWAELVGRDIAAVTEPLFVTPDGSLFVAVRTNAWMTELQLMEPQLVRALNTDSERPRVRKLRFQLRRPD